MEACDLMPSVSPKQKHVMAAIAHGWRPTGSAAGIPVSVAKEFHAADKAKKSPRERVTRALAERK
jgi:hypothetical protein